ncbi:MAG: acyl-CoA desaturase [Xanthomonadaceae bacterium]|nr:acyl-CoA desaturase [Xanthomonadaceae bacterium]
MESVEKIKADSQFLLTPRFADKSLFSKEIEEAVRSYLVSLEAQKVKWAPLLKGVILTLICFSQILFVFLSPPASVLEGTLRLIAIAFSVMFFGLNVMHEAAHRNLPGGEWVNMFFSYAMDILGISSRVYRLKHVGFHHQFTNIYGWDGDISETPLIRMAPSQEKWSMHRYQHLYAPMLYTLLTFAWVFNDLERIVFRKVGRATIKRFKAWEITEILAFKFIHVYLFIVLPSLQFGFLKTFGGYMLVQGILGLCLALIFQVAHLDQGSEFTSRESPHDWKVHQILSSADFSTNSPLTDFMMGGLNYQVIHHLYPHVSYRHYPAMQKIVAQKSREHGIAYREYNSFYLAVKSHLLFLKRLGSS